MKAWKIISNYLEVICGVFKSIKIKEMQDWKKTPKYW